MADLIPWSKRTNPFRMMDTLGEEMSRFFNMPMPRFSEWMSESPQGLWSPAVDVEEENGHVKVLAEMPGLKKEDIDVRVEGHSVVIKGEKKHETSGKENGYLRRERSYGSFYRRIELPEECDAQKIEASYKNGVLELTMPKRPEAQSKQVQIQVK